MKNFLNVLWNSLFRIKMMMGRTFHAYNLLYRGFLSRSDGPGQKNNMFNIEKKDDDYSS